MNVTLPSQVLHEMRAHAAAAYPKECCGIVVERCAGLEVVRVSNLQDELHAQDPEQFPRTAETAYTMGPEAAPILLAHERGKARVYAFYHSHPKHGAYFSSEDRTQAKGGWDEPMYPDAGQVVLSVFDAEVGAIAAFRWDGAQGDFVEVPLQLTD